MFGAHGYLTAREDYVITADVARTPLRPALPDELDGLGLRLHSLSATAGQDAVAETITYVFGEATCSECGTVFSVAEY